MSSGKPLAPAVCERIVALHKQGLSTAIIAERMSLPRGTVTHKLRDLCAERGLPDPSESRVDRTFVMTNEEAREFASVRGPRRILPRASALPPPTPAETAAAVAAFLASGRRPTVCPTLHAAGVRPCLPRYTGALATETLP